MGGLFFLGRKPRYLREVSSFAGESRGGCGKFILSRGKTAVVVGGSFSAFRGRNTWLWEASSLRFSEERRGLFLLCVSRNYRALIAGENSCGCGRLLPVSRKKAAVVVGRI